MPLVLAVLESADTMVAGHISNQSSVHDRAYDHDHAYNSRCTFTISEPSARRRRPVPEIHAWIKNEFKTDSQWQRFSWSQLVALQDWMKLEQNVSLGLEINFNRLKIL